MSLPRCFGVLGDPVAHSRSPAMHAAAFASLGLPHRYLAFHVRADGLAAALAGARALGFGGVNLTVPHKLAGAGLCDELGAAARRIGAVNTVVFAERATIGENTDSAGFAAAVGELGEAAVSRALVLGGGGAALAVLDAVVHALGAREVGWVSRDPAGLAAAIAARPGLAGVRALGWDALTAAADGADLLVNCTTVGMRGGPAEFPAVIDPSRLAGGARVVDIVYPRPPGGLLDRAAEAGCVVQDGLPMLLWQGVRALERWLAAPLPAATVAAMRAALLA
ncbi:MAG: shikimate dehydrogenase [Myxococcales bacterium]|nr:shikimate dehydrogenase [Myxococcales bacterium]